MIFWLRKKPEKRGLRTSIHRLAQEKPSEPGPWGRVGKGKNPFPGTGKIGFWKRLGIYTP